MEKKTPLNSRHRAEGAHMAVFGGYEMPLWYPTGARNEHLAVLTDAGIFDTSHMSLITVSGQEARNLLQFCFTKDLDRCLGKNKTPLVRGRSAYGAFLYEDGAVLDDAIVSQFAEDSYCVVVNAGMGGPVVAHLNKQAHAPSSVSVIDLTDRVGKIDIQGPCAARLLESHLADPRQVFERMPYFSFKGHYDDRSPLSDEVRLTDGTPVLLSRTGYTGEFGFELFMDTKHLIQVWDNLVRAGRDAGLTPCGLAARDSLRAGAVLPLSHQDIGPWPFINHPWQYALPYDETGTRFTKPFLGNDALRHCDHTVYVYPFAGFDLRKVAPGASSAVINGEGDEIGTVLTCVTDVAIDRHEGTIYSIASPDAPEGFTPKGLCCGFIKVTAPLAYGSVIEITHGRRTLKAEIVQDIRPDRTARKPMVQMLSYYRNKEMEHERN